MKSKITVISLLICGLLSGCSSSQGQKGDITKQPGIQEGQGDNQPDGSQEDFHPTVYEDDIFYIKKDNIVPIDTTVEYEGIRYHIDNISVTKERGKHDKEKINYLTDEVNENGDFIGSKRFVWINFTVENILDKENEINMNGFEVCQISNADGKVVAILGGEGVYINPIEKGRKPREEFDLSLKQKESRTVEAGYMIELEELDENKDCKFCILLGEGGSELGEVDNKFWDLGDYWNETVVEN